MPERGRPTADSGNAYHDVTVVIRMVELIRDPRIVDVTPEAAAPTDDIRTRLAGGPARYEQVKERAPGTTWSASALVGQKVLRQFLRQQDHDREARLNFVTGSDAGLLREISDRARSAAANYPEDAVRGEAEWWDRLSEEQRRFCRTVCRMLSISQDRLFFLASAITVEDNQGLLTQRREGAATSLALLVSDGREAEWALERLARTRAIERRAIRRSDVEETLAEAGLQIHFGHWAFAIDHDAYASQLRALMSDLDAAGLPELQIRLEDQSGNARTMASLPARSLLVGGHGHGKSRRTLQEARTQLEQGSGALHVRLGNWATSLSDLIQSELAVAAGRTASGADLDAALADPSLTIFFDGLDEVGTGDRDTAERELLQFGRTYPHVRAIATTRPTSRSLTRLGWDSFYLRDVSDDEAERVLGVRLFNLPAGIRGLIGNPLLLGLVRQSLAEGRLAESESDLLDGFLEEVCRREEARSARPDRLTGLRLAEEVAFAWLASDRIALDRSTFRDVCAQATAILRSRDGLQLDTVTTETWMIESGLATEFGGSVYPLHRSVLDHLASRALTHRDPTEVVGRPELREAIARYIAGSDGASEPQLAMTEAVGDDLEILARARRLIRPDFAWPFSPDRFARIYHVALRRLSSGPLGGIGLIDPAIHLTITSDLQWIQEFSLVGESQDVVEVVDRPGGGGNILGIRSDHMAGAVIDRKEPTLTAFKRAAGELEHRLKDRELPAEGPELTYERLVSYADRMESLFSTGRDARMKRGELSRVTPNQLVHRFRVEMERFIGRPPTDSELESALFVWVPPVQQLVLMVDTEPSRRHPLDLAGRRSGFAIHGYSLAHLFSRACSGGIDDLPLHPLGLLPSGPDDPLLLLPDRRHMLRGKDLLLFLERHELLVMSALRNLVELNLIGLKPFLSHYQALPIRSVLYVEDRSTASTWDGTVRYVQYGRADRDEVQAIAGEPPSGLELGGWASLHSFRGPLEAAYQDLETDARALFGGSTPLGRLSL